MIKKGRRGIIEAFFHGSLIRNNDYFSRNDAFYVLTHETTLRVQTYAPSQIASAKFRHHYLPQFKKSVLSFTMSKAYF